MVRALDSHQFGLGPSLAMYAIYVLGTGYYLLPGGGEGILGGITRFVGEQKGHQSKLRTQKRGSLKTSEGFRRGITQNCLENEDGGGGISKVIKSC